jgi:glycosyltransferase involved in cell wall biosynthesis
MRIVHVLNSSEKGVIGIERRVLYLAIAQKARGSSVLLVLDHPGALAEDCRQHDIPVIVADSLAQEGMRLGPPRENVTRDLITKFMKFNPDLIHCHTLRAAAQAIPAGNRINIPCVLTFNGPSALTAARNAGMRFTTILVSRKRFEEAKNSGKFSEKEIYYVSNGTRVAPLTRLQEMSRSDRPNLMLVGSLEVRKGIDVAILAMTVLRSRLGPDCPILNIYGDGEQEKYLKEMTTVLGLRDIVRFWGYQPDILERSSGTNILVMSSRSETGPQVVLEAMSRGMPIVATDVGEVTDMIPDQRYGRIVPVDSIVKLADAVESFLWDISLSHFNPDLLIERHRACYTDEKMAERIEGIYEQILLDGSSVVAGNRRPPHIPGVEGPLPSG